MIESVVERLTGDGDAERGHLGEVRQTEPAGFVRLAEDDLLLLTVDGTPASDAPLQRPAHALAQLGMAQHHLLENGHGPDAGRCPQQRHDFRVENVGDWIGTPSCARLLLLRR